MRPVLSKNGLAVSQIFEPGEAGPPGHVTLTTLLLHASGQWLAGTCCLPLAKLDAQGYGSAAPTRAATRVLALLGIGDEDDDGNAAAAPERQTGEPGG